MKMRLEWPALFFVLVGGLLAAFLLPACGGSGTERVGKGTGAIVARPVLQVSPPVVSIPATVEQQFSATLLIPRKPPNTLSSGVTWTVSAPKVARVNSAGLLTALAPGSATVTAAYSGLTASATVTVTAATLVSVAVTPPIAEIQVDTAGKIKTGTQASFRATGIFSDGTTASLAGAVTWKSSNTAVATIDSTGVASGVASRVASGIAPSATITALTITATDNATGLSGDAVLTVDVEKGALKSESTIALSPTAPSVPNGATVPFTATLTEVAEVVKIRRGTPGTISSTVDLTDDLTWASSNPNVATISNAPGSQGVATAVGVGTTTISAGSLTATLTVTSALLTSIAVTPLTEGIPNGTAAPFVAIGTYSDQTTQNITAAVTWTSSSSAAFVSNATGSNGLATALKLGTATITATDPTTGIKGTATLTVTAAVLQALSITPPMASVALGLPEQFIATGTYTDSTTQNLTNAVTWSSSTPSVATVSNAAGSAGLASTGGAGSTTITASAPGTTITASASLTVNPAVLVSIAISPQTATIANGFAQQFTATGTYSDGSTQNLTSVDSWSVTTGTAVFATGPNHGLATSSGVGTSTVQVTDPSGISATATLIVTAATVFSVAVTPATPSVPLGTTERFTATATMTDGTTSNVTAAVTWSATNGEAISNAAGSYGLATGSVTGLSTITATYVPPGGTGTTVSGSTTLNVTAATLVSIAVTPPTPTVAVGATQQFTATGTYTDGSTQDVTQSVTWQSSAPSIFAVSGAAGSIGLGTALMAGMATLTAIDPTTQISGSAAVTVAPASTGCGFDGNNWEASCYTFAEGTTNNTTFCGYQGSEATYIGSDTTGACVTGKLAFSDTVPNVGTNPGYFVAFPSSNPAWGPGAYCGMCVDVTYGGTTLMATIVDECPAPCAGSPDLLDLSANLARDLGVGVGSTNGVPVGGVSWAATACPITSNDGNIVVVWNSSSSFEAYFQNVVFPVASVSGATQTQGFWNVAPGETVTLTDILGHQITATLPGPGGGSLGAQFPATCPAGATTGSTTGTSTGMTGSSTGTSTGTTGSTTGTSTGTTGIIVGTTTGTTTGGTTAVIQF